MSFFCYSSLEEVIKVRVFFLNWTGLSYFMKVNIFLNWIDLFYFNANREGNANVLTQRIVKDDSFWQRLPSVHLKFLPQENLISCQKFAHFSQNEFYLLPASALWFFNTFILQNRFRFCQLILRAMENFNSISFWGILGCRTLMEVEVRLSGKSLSILLKFPNYPDFPVWKSTISFPTCLLSRLHNEMAGGEENCRLPGGRLANERKDTCSSCKMWSPDWWKQHCGIAV